jgi:acetyl esterase/lipase
MSIANVDPELRPGLDAYLSANRTYDAEGLRAYREQISGYLKAAPKFRPPSVLVDDVSIPGPGGHGELALRVFRPATSETVPAVYWMHGGGMMVGTMDMDDAFLVRMVDRLKLAAVSVEYRLAPENPDPAPLDDCFTGLQWVVDHADEFAIDRERIAVAGISAGGGLAAGLALQARDRGAPHIAFQLLLAPMLDDRISTPSSTAYPQGIVWNSEANRQGWTALLGDRRGTDAVSTYAAPARAVDLAGLPAAFIDVGEVETFRDECIDYAQRLADTGVSTEFHLYRGAVHGFDTMAPDSSVARIAWEIRWAALTKALRLDASFPFRPPA